MVFAGEGGDQHDQGAFREVEVGDEGVYGFELVAGVDEDVRPAGLGGEGAVGAYQGFQGTAGGGAHADDAAAGCLGLVEDIRCLLIDHAKLAVHMMV